MRCTFPHRILLHTVHPPSPLAPQVRVHQCPRGQQGECCSCNYTRSVSPRPRTSTAVTTPPCLASLQSSVPALLPPRLHLPSPLHPTTNHHRPTSTVPILRCGAARPAAPPAPTSAWASTPAAPPAPATAAASRARRRRARRRRRHRRPRPRRRRRRPTTTPAVSRACTVSLASPAALLCSHGTTTVPHLSSKLALSYAIRLHCLPPSWPCCSRRRLPVPRLPPRRRPGRPPVLLRLQPDGQPGEPDHINITFAHQPKSQQPRTPCRLSPCVPLP